MTNKAIAQVLEETGLLAQLAGENAFKTKAYERAADAVAALGWSVSARVEQGQALDVPGVGAGIAAGIEELVTTGTFPKHAQYAKQVPPGLLEVAKLPGLGPKKVQTLWQDHGIASLDDLQDACERNAVAQWKGFGEKTQAKIYNAIQYRAQNRSKLLLPKALELAETWRQRLAELPALQRLGATGELRRQLPVIEALEWVAATDDPEAMGQALNQLTGEAALNWTRHDDADLPGPRYTAHNADGVGLHLLTCPPSRWAATIFRTTAAAAHLTHLQALADELSLPDAPPDQDLDAYETQVYQQLNLPPLPPETREDPERIYGWAAGAPFALLAPQDVLGVLHAHTTWSDGLHTLRDMANGCQERGYHYLGLTDHSQTAAYAGGLKPDRVRQQWQEVDALNKELEGGFRIFKGIESDILADGSLDYTEEVLAGFELVIASVHGGMNMGQEQATQRLITAIANPHTRILGHATGRLLLNRPGYPIDHLAVLDACAKHKVAIEINANPYRLDVDWTWLSAAIDRGVWIAICPDAHSTDELDLVQWGVTMARKGGVPPSHCLNRLDADALAEWLKAPYAPGA